jgi:GNAT superfamily N-acetyltransferase
VADDRLVDEQVRPATAGDHVALAELERLARAAVLEQRGGPQLLDEQPAVVDWAARIADDDGDVFVGTLDEVVVGYLELRYAGAVAVVRQAYVEPEARELGLGDDMLLAAMDAARRRGCTAVEGTALPGDRSTKNLYERAGITARKITVWKRLAPDP